jgi:hypothetical protein
MVPALPAIAAATAAKQYQWFLAGISGSSGGADTPECLQTVNRPVNDAERTYADVLS